MAASRTDGVALLGLVRAFIYTGIKLRAKLIRLAGIPFRFDPLSCAYYSFYSKLQFILTFLIYKFYYVSGYSVHLYV
jgi:hypothetical protein